MAQQVPNQRLRQTRESRNESREEFAAAIRRMGRDIGENVGCSKRLVAAWEDGEIACPRPVYRRILSALLGLSPTELGFAPNNGPDSAARAPAPAPAPTPGGGGEVLDRRAFTAGMIGGVMPLAAGRGREPLPSLLDIGADVRLVPAQLSALEQRVGGAAVLDLATTQLKMFQHLSRLTERSGTREGRELLSTIGWIGRIAAWSAFDSGDPNLARVLFGEARSYALMSGDSLLLADLANLLSHQELYLGNPSEALSVIATVHREATDELSHPKVRALFRIREMQARALLKDTAGVRECEREALSLFDMSERHPDELWWLGFLSRGETSRQLGSAYLDLGEPARAEQFLRESTNVSRADFTRNDTYWRIRLAQSLALLGENDEAAALAQDVLHHYWVDGSGRIRSQLLQFGRMLDPRRGGAAAREFHGLLREAQPAMAAELTG